MVLTTLDPWLAGLLAPIEATQEEIPDFRGESLVMDLAGARAWLEGSQLVARASGAGIAKTGVWFQLDTQGGPAPDLRVGVGEGWIRAAGLNGWLPGPDTALSGEIKVDPGFPLDTIQVRVDLAPLLRLEERALLPGSAVAFVESREGFQDFGPAGPLKAAPSWGLAVLEAMEEAAEPGELLGDPNLAGAVALNFGVWWAVVAPELQETVLSDALGWYRYGRGLDSWLEAKGYPWKLSELPPAAKLLWAWPGGQAAVYGSLPVSWAERPLTLEEYRFSVAGPDLLVRLREAMPVQDSLWELANRQDEWVWQHLKYRGPEGAMRALCRNGVLTPADCKAWLAEFQAKATLGKVGEHEIALDGGVSAGYQWARFEKDGYFVGDCATASSLSLASYQAVGIAGLPLGFGGPDWSYPTHEQPLLLEKTDSGWRLFSPQVGPSPAFALEETFVYAVLPILGPMGMTLGWEPGGWARGGAAPGGWMRYGELSRRLEDGIPLEKVMEWVEVQVAGGWGEF